MTSVQEGTKAKGSNSGVISSALNSLSIGSALTAGETAEIRLAEVAGAPSPSEIGLLDIGTSASGV